MSIHSVLTPAACEFCPPTLPSRDSSTQIDRPLQSTSCCNATGKHHHLISTLSSASAAPKGFQWRSGGSTGSLQHLTHKLRKLKCFQKASPGVRACGGEDGGADQWVKMLPDKKSALYSHSLPCIEAWLRKMGFRQSKDERAIWVIERPDWHAQLSLDITDLSIRYLKSGPGKLDRDVERKFSYALCREDLENAILGGP